MLFNSLSYAVFLPVVFTLYWIMPGRLRWIILFVSSYYFYMSWKPQYIILIFGTTLITYCAGRLIEEFSTNYKIKKIILYSSVVICVGTLFLFKYFNFVSSSFASVFKVFSIELNPVTVNLLLPVGISFYTFQTMSYVVDVYRGNIMAEKHFGYYATFISFFPQLVAGPIERTNNLLPQIKNPSEFDSNKAILGLNKILWGFFKKAAVADTLAAYVDVVYENIPQYAGLSTIFAVFFFTIQIYCDFSGYSDIAIGSAYLFGIDLMENFRCPYFAISIHDFWKRWHISLSTWFKDYLYIPLGGNRCSKVRQIFNLLATFLISGLWHGANWTFVIWGGFHGILQIIENSFKEKKELLTQSQVGKIISWVSVFTLCNIGWVFFRAETVKDAIKIFSNMFVGIGNLYQFRCDGFNKLNLSAFEFFQILSMLCVLTVGDYLIYTNKVSKIRKAVPTCIKYFVYAVFIWFILFMIPVNGGGEFIYFQF